MSDLIPSTPAERARAELFTYRGDTIAGPESRIVLSGDSTVISSVPPASETETEKLRRIVCSSDLVVAGRPRSQKALLNQNRTFLFTDYEVVIDSWVRPSGGLTSARSITVSLFGGRVRVGTGLLETVLANKRMLTIGDPYVFFVKRTGDHLLVPTPPAVPLAHGRDGQLMPPLWSHRTQDGLVKDMEGIASTCRG